MRQVVLALFLAVPAGNCAAAAGNEQGTEQIVQQAVQTELAADASDHTRWVYFEVDRKPNLKVEQWVAETGQGDVKRVLEENGRRLSESEQHTRMDGFVQNEAAQAKQQKSRQRDDEQARQMLSMLPQAFVWTEVNDQNGRTILHFAPNPHFHPPSYQARVFAAMQGEMTVDDAQHRIASIKGRMIHDVKFGYELFGELRAGGTFDVERRELKPGIWQITETHVHIEGRALIFKSISDEEDDVKSQFKQIAPDLQLANAEKTLMAQKNS